ncbi:AAA family ATPase [Catenovulum agarivorans]|uniref:AAA family ATPase n=1 Tax=Catenovulum agarivorans TaxID=1172192 RepID=UPI00030ACABD|nr:AAA family ATPase [Catenovulum agarivorans]
MDNSSIINLVDAALSGNQRIIKMAIHKLATKARTSDNELYQLLSTKLKLENFRSFNGNTKPLPVDSDSRQALVRVEETTSIDIKPIHSAEIEKLLNQVILEHQHSNVIIESGIYPTKSIIFQGPPGVGKTMSAKWLAKELNLPLLVLDLATVMSSFLGKTGSNIRAVLEYAMDVPCVLLLDEFDSIAKRRDDDRELGELKRLVTVLLQAIDDWPSTSILIAATNHGELLDPAIWRRFDIEVKFELPTPNLVNQYLSSYWPDVPITKTLINSFNGESFSNIERELTRIKRQSILSGLALRSCLLDDDLCDHSSLSMAEKKSLVLKLSKDGFSQRAISEKLNISRPTIRKVINQNKDKEQR